MTTQREIEDAVRARYGPRATLRYRGSEGSGQWWATGGDGQLLAAAPTLETLAAKLRPRQEEKPMESTSTHDTVPHFASWRTALVGGYISTGDAARELGVSRSGLNGFINERGLPAEKVKIESIQGPPKWRIKRSDLHEWAAKNKWNRFRNGKPRKTQAPSAPSRDEAAMRVMLRGAVAVRLTALSGLAGMDVEAWVNKVVAEALTRVKVSVQ